MVSADDLVSTSSSELDSSDSSTHVHGVLFVSMCHSVMDHEIAAAGGLASGFELKDAPLSTAHVKSWGILILSHTSWH